MPFEKSVILSYNDLDIPTKLRFLELEMLQAIKILHENYGTINNSYQRAIEEFVIMLAGPKSLPFRDELENALASIRFRKPSRDELVQYFRYKNIGVARISKYAQVSPNTIQTYKNSYPQFKPVFTRWTEDPTLLNRWTLIKKNFNLFNDRVIHEDNPLDLNLFFEPRY